MVSTSNFFSTIIYGLLFKVSGEEKPIEQAPEILCEDYYAEFCTEKDSLGLDTSLFNFFEKCMLANELLSKQAFFKGL